MFVCSKRAHGTCGAILRRRFQPELDVLALEVAEAERLLDEDARDVMK